jgi:hypothetical protein
MLCSLLKVNQNFEGTYYLNLQGWRIGQASNQHEAGSKQNLLFNPDNEGDVILRKVYFHQIIWYYIQDIRVLTVNAVGTSNPMQLCTLIILLCANSHMQNGRVSMINGSGHGEKYLP